MPESQAAETGFTATRPCRKTRRPSPRGGAHGQNLGIHPTAAALGEIGPGAKDAIPALTAALKEKDEAVRTAAAEAIKKIERK
jgi:hypothetical protein